MLVRVIFAMTDAGKIRQTREKIGQAVTKFQVYDLIYLELRSVSPTEHASRSFPISR